LIPWQHCQSCCSVLIGKSLQLEKKDTAKSKLGAAKSKINPQKQFAHRQVPSHCGVHFQMRSRKYTHILKFIYEDDIKIVNKYFAAV
jgi:hypothetical protein